MSSDGSRYDGDAGSVPAPASAAPTVGSNGAATSAGVYRSGRTSAVAGAPVAESCAATFAAPIATVGPCADNSSTAGPGSGPAPTRVAPRIDLTPRIWSTMSAAPLVAIAFRPPSPTRRSASTAAFEYVVAPTPIRCANALSPLSQ